MSRGQLHTVLHQLHRLAAAADAEKQSDRQLLRRFADTRDEDAFAVLVRRHGPLVLGVCRRALLHVEDAEDVFQATFLILARKAGATRWHNSIASWLYTVASHLAKRTRQRRERRREQERQAGQMARTKSDSAEAWREIGSLLDEEMQRLPERYRQPLLLCYLEGLTRDRAAQQLGWSLRTLERRLSQGRERLRQRLTRRGVALPAALLVANLLPEESSAAAPLLLLRSTVEAAAAFQRGGLPAAGISPEVIALAKGGLRSMAAVKVKLMMLLVLLAGGAAGGAGVLARQAFVGEPPQAAQRETQPQAAPGDRKPKEKLQAHVDRYGDPLPPGVIARLGTLRFRHEGEANALAFSPDGKILAGMCNGNILLWDATTGRELRRLKVMVRGRDTRPFDFSPDGKTLAVVETVKSIDFFEVASGKKLRTLPVPSGFGPLLMIPILRFAPDGKSLALTVGTDKVAVVDAQSGKVIHAMGGHRASIYGLAFAPDGKTLAMATLKPSLQLWDVETGKLRLGIEQKPKDTFAHTVAFSPDGRLVAAGWWDRIGVYGADNGKETARLEEKMQSINGLAFTPDSKTLVSGTQDGKVRVWDVAEKKLRLTLSGRWGVGRALALSSDGKTAALGTSARAIRLWDIGSGKELFTQFEGHNTHLHAAVFSPDGQMLFTGSDNQVRIWRTKDWRQTRLFQGTARSLSVTPDGKRLASVQYGKTVRVWDTATGEEVYPLKLPDTETVHGAHFAIHGDVLVSLDDTRLPREQPKDQYRSRLTVWDMFTGRPRRSMMLPGVSPYSFTVAPDGRTAFLGTIEQTIVVCDLDRGEMYRKLHGFQHNVYALAVSPDGRLLLSGSYDRSIRLWEVDSGAEAVTFASHPRAVTAVAFSADGRVAASADGNGGVPYPVADPRQVRLWDVATGKEIGRLQGHEADISALAFSPDGRRLVSAMGDSTILVWDVAFLADAVRRKPIDLDRAALESAWKDLASGDAGKAHRAIGSLTDASHQTVPFLKEHLRPVAPLDAEQVRKWIAEMDSDDFKVREAAFQSLTQSGRQVELALRQTLADKPSLEMRRRVEDLLRHLLKNPSTETLRTLRAIAVLERIGSSEARQVLRALAQGASAARETQAAESVLQRK
jgi:RNA polymerase sigma factor (sigma-70 family)